MKSRAVTGSTSRRLRCLVYAWMRVSTRRAHHSSGPSGSVNRPRSANPSFSSRIRAMVTLDTPSAVVRESSSAVTGPDTSRCPRSISAVAVSASMGLTSGITVPGHTSG